MRLSRPAGHTESPLTNRDLARTPEEGETTMKTKTTKPAVTTYDVAWYVHERDLAPGGSPVERPDVAILLD